MDAWLRAGELVIEILDADPNAVDEICKAVPGLPREAIYRFEAIGRRTVHPKLLLSEAPGIRKLAAMPYSVQETFIAAPLQVLIEKDGGCDTLQVSVGNLTPEQCRQVFGSNHVRDAAEQRAWMEAEKRIASMRNEKAEDLPYAIHGNKIVFRRSCTMTKRELQTVLKAM
jgi:hypothetical protein